jgi:NAD(P)-dependent dehydrogenase (short-subunit alcohol dehydrogenase family)
VSTSTFAAGSRILITGGTGGIGAATVRRFVAEGAWVVASGRSTERGAELVRELGERVRFIAADVTRDDQLNDLFDEAAGWRGRLDVLFNIAGGFVWQTTDDADPAWASMFALNVATALNASRAALPHLKASAEGRIVNVGANAALKSAAGMGAYAASKAGVHRLTESLAEELKDSSVTVNAVLPSILDTARNRQDMPDADPAKWVAPADLARVMLFLASPGSRAITGALIPVTGRV